MTWNKVAKITPLKLYIPEPAIQLHPQCTLHSQYCRARVHVLKGQTNIIDLVAYIFHFVFDKTWLPYIDPAGWVKVNRFSVGPS